MEPSLRFWDTFELNSQSIEENGGITLIKRSTDQQQTNKVATKRSNKRPLALSPADQLLSFVYFSDQADVCSNPTVVFSTELSPRRVCV